MGAPFSGGQGSQQPVVPLPVWNPLTNPTFTADPGVEEGGYIEVLNYTNAILVASGVEFQSLDIPPLSRWVRQAGPVGIPTMSFITGPTMPGLITFLDRMQFNVYQPSDAKPTLVSGPLLSLPGVQVPTSSIQPGALPEGVTIGADDVGSSAPAEFLGQFCKIAAAQVGAAAAPDIMSLVDTILITLATAKLAIQAIYPSVPVANQLAIDIRVSGDTATRVGAVIRSDGFGQLNLGNGTPTGVANISHQSDGVHINVGADELVQDNSGITHSSVWDNGTGTIRSRREFEGTTDPSTYTTVNEGDVWDQV